MQVIYMGVVRVWIDLPLKLIHTTVEWSAVPRSYTFGEKDYQFTMSRNISQGPPFLHKLIVGTVAVVVGVYAAWDALKDFELVKYTPFSEEEVRKRMEEKKGLKITHLDTRTLDYTPEAKERLRKRAEEEEKLKNQTS